MTRRRALSTTMMDVRVEYGDVIRAHEQALEHGWDAESLTVVADVDIEEALEEATLEQLREALGREDPGYTEEQLDAISDCFDAVLRGQVGMALNLLPRVFDHMAQRNAAESALRHCRERIPHDLPRPL